MNITTGKPKVILADHTFPLEMETPKLEMISREIDIESEIVPNGDRGALLSDQEAAKLALVMLADGKDLSMGALTGRGNPLSRTEFVALRDALIDAGLAYWQNPRAHAQGCALTIGGRKVLQRYAYRLPDSPLAGNGGELKLITAD